MPTARLVTPPILVALLAALLAAAPVEAQKRPADFPWIAGDTEPPDFPELLVGADDLPDGALILTAPLRVSEPGEAPILDGACIARGVFCVRQRLARLGLSGEETIVVEGDDPAAVGHLFWLLEWAGFSGVRILDPAATEAERPAGWRPLPPPPEPAAADLAVPVAPDGPHGVIAVDRAWVRERFGTPEVELVDLRSREAWAAGHLPHSLPFDFRKLLDEDGWPDPAVARRALGRLGPRPSTPVDLAATFVVYDGGGAEGDELGLAYLLLRMMGVEAAVFPGGWTEWRAEPSSPVVRVVRAEEVRELLAAANPELADRPVPGVTLLDVRGERDHFVRHLPGSIGFPSRTCPETDWSVVPEPPSGDRLDAPLVFYCYGRSCIRSRDCSTAAARAGFREVLWFRDGVPAWHEAGLPLYRSGKPGETATRLPGPNDS